MSFCRKSEKGVDFFVSDLLPCPHAFSTRLGGVSTLPHLSSMNLGENRGDEPSNVQENFKRLLSAAGLPARYTSAFQVHSKTVLYADDSPSERPHADGFYTDKKGLSLCVKVADCLPILLCDKEAGIIAALHAGWRGSALNIVGEGVKKMEQSGASPSRIIAAIGPGIGRCCFAVKEDFLSEFSSLVGAETSKKFIHQTETQPHADLKELNRFLLLQAGLTPEHIDICPLCTCCAPDLFFSHRASKGLRGTMGALIAL